MLNGLKARDSRLVRDYLDSTRGAIETGFLLPMRPSSTSLSIDCVFEQYPRCRVHISLIDAIESLG